MNLADSRAMVAQLFWYAPTDKQTLIARHMVAADTNAMHAAWELFGRARGFPCSCTPCERSEWCEAFGDRTCPIADTVPASSCEICAGTGKVCP